MFLSLWDAQGTCTDYAESAEHFWQMLSQHSPRFQRALKRVCHETLYGDGVVCDESTGGVFVFGIPIVHRHRPLAAIVVCALKDDFLDGEGFARFCSQCEIDQAVTARLAVDLPRYSERSMRAHAEIMQQSIECFSRAQLATRELSDLSSHLGQAYEELNLIYRVSANLTVLSQPVAHFQTLSEEITASTVVESFATVLEPAGDSREEPTVVKGGPLRASNADLIRLYQIARDRRPNAGQVLVLNNVAGDEELAWAADWAHHLVFLLLDRNEHTFGGLLAINRVDRREFGSEEIQLINSVAEGSTVFLENLRLYDDLEQLFMGMMHALVSSIDAKDPYTSGHSQRVAWLSRHIAQLAGTSEASSQRVYLSGLLHDIGKIGISEAVLRKSGRLTPEEFEEMKRHPAIGARILENVKQVQDVIPGVLHHHERFDAKGYPRSLSGGDLSFLGRVIGLADSFDAMTTSRTYRRACPLPIAVAEMRRCAGTQFDPLLVDLLLQEDLRVLMRRMNEPQRPDPRSPGR
jgi:HD-GYP domain-containing protein (c-di-GMP phosphodiesterase class II)